jgi:hypothetical protein
MPDRVLHQRLHRRNRAAQHGLLRGLPQDLVADPLPERRAEALVRQQHRHDPRVVAADCDMKRGLAAIRAVSGEVRALLQHCGYERRLPRLTRVVQRRAASQHMPIYPRPLPDEQQRHFCLPLLYGVHEEVLAAARLHRPLENRCSFAHEGRQPFQIPIVHGRLQQPELAIEHLFQHTSNRQQTFDRNILRPRH